MVDLKKFWLFLLGVAVVAWMAGCADQDSGPQAKKAVSELEQMKQNLNAEKIIFEREKEELLQQLHQQQAQIEQVRTELAQKEKELQAFEQELNARQARLNKFRTASWVIFILGLALIIGGIAILVRNKSIQVVKDVLTPDDLSIKSAEEPEPAPVASEPIQTSIVPEPAEIQIVADEAVPEVTEPTKPKKARKQTRKPQEPEA